MSVEGIIFAVILTAGVAFVALRPLFRARSITTSTSREKQRERVLAYYERVLLNVRDLDDDHATGKIHADEYAQERELWVSRGTALLALLDELDDHNIAEADASDAEIDALIEAKVSALKQKGAIAS
jgi:hypothetical protein